MKLFHVDDLCVYTSDDEYVRHFVFEDGNIEVFRVSVDNLIKNDRTTLSILLNIIVGYSISQQSRLQSFNKLQKDIIEFISFFDRSFQDGISVKLSKHSQAT